jgi:PQQ-dependent dehydrogenase (methanol/ethanol family)
MGEGHAAFTRCLFKFIKLFKEENIVMKKRYLSLALAGLLLGGAALAQEASNELMDLMADDSQWVTPAKDYASTRFSTLDQITPENVDQLEVAWSMSTGVLRGHEGQPLVIGEMMYFTTAFPNIVYAIDLNSPNEIAWKFTPDNNPAAIGVACCDVVNRGVAYGDGKIIVNSLDGHVHALDAKTGELLWRVKNADVSKGATMTNAPLVVKDKVIVGMSGGEFGVRGYITAYNLDDGSQAWRWYNTGPDEEVGITDDFFSPYYDWLKGEDLGVKTWPKDQWKIGGSSVWGWFSYDPELNLVYYGTSNPGTWNASIRRNGQETLDDQTKWANLWSTAVMARDLDTGELKWAYPMTPHDEWDYDGINEMILSEMEIDGEMRKVLTHFDRNGFAYNIDRETGQVYSAETFGEGVNWASEIDLETGLPVRNPEKSTNMAENTTNICPSAMGYKDQQPASYSPETGLFYVPSNNLCMDYQGTEATYIAGVPYVGATVKTYNGPGGHGGAVFAWDPVKNERVWEVKEQFAAWGGTLITTTGVVFYGTLDGFFKAVNAETGEVLWQHKAGSGIIGNPITYLGPDGDQYVAVLSGVGGWSGLTVAGDLSLDDPTAALGAVNAFADLGRYTQKGGQLYVFSLPKDNEQASN